MLPFYSVDSVPAHSCVLLDSRDEAIDYPRGSILLAFCTACGFISNLHFDPALNDYSSSYEDTQHFSARFNQYARSLVDRLVRDYGIRDKTVLEIGCGQGEFLAMLCQAGNNRGIGIDPACRSNRSSQAKGDRITFISDFYSEAYRHVSADLICCRHTLEHIQGAGEFLRMIRRSIGDQAETLLFFEVPDAERILRQNAFWDIYYEHCSYFTPGSLARLFQRSGFEIQELVRDFDDQYLWLTACPCRQPLTARGEPEADLDQLARDVEHFQGEHRVAISRWDDTLSRACVEHRRPVLWGASSKSVAFLSALSCASEIKHVVDINPNKHGKYLPGTGQEIVSPDFLAHYRSHLVVAMNPAYRDEIAAVLRRIGVSPDLVTVEAGPS